VSIAKEEKMEHLNIDPEPIGFNLFGILEVTNTLLAAYLASAILIVIAIIIRIFFIPRLKERPSKAQLVLEMAVDGIQVFTQSKVEKWAAASLAPYIFTVGLFIVFNGILELFGMRPAMTDINTTIALAVITFVLIQVYALKKKGLKGRLQHYKPYPLAPIKIITDLAVPVSLSCRLFGNILGGMIVMELLYSIVVAKWFIPAFASIYFTLFHTAIQALIFVTLSLAFVNEAIE
jgi:F-type H+-transporting ATPase subunit a